jgi:SnoaL-like domain
MLGADMSEREIEELYARIRYLEDESAITKLILTYGPAADAGLASFAGGLWTEQGAYDWDADGDPHLGSGGVEAMLRSDGHQGLIARGVAHFSGSPLIEIDGDHGTALNYSMVMRLEGDRFFLWRVSAVRWDLERVGPRWRVGKRTNRLLTESGGGRQLFEGALKELFEVAEQ